jgi:TrmH family RNA methyltransferase
VEERDAVRSAVLSGEPAELGAAPVGRYRAEIRLLEQRQRGLIGLEAEPGAVARTADRAGRIVEERVGVQGPKGARLEVGHPRERIEDVVRRVQALGSGTQQLGRAAFEKVAYREGPDGFLAVVDSVVRSCADLSVGPAPMVLVCQGVEKPGNLGAMLRTADAAGVEAVVAVDPVTDWGNPNLVRASKGTVFSIPVASASTAEALKWLSDNDIPLAATTPDTDLYYSDVDYTGPMAIAVGAEKYGLTEDLLAAAEYRIRIPMVGRANSLNVAASAAVVIYEAVRQRRGR